MSEEWRADYNTERPHKSLGKLSPGVVPSGEAFL
ncbi:MAG: hypothetical protein C4330_12705 [Chitinophagaceae bacterium]